MDTIHETGAVMPEMPRFDDGMADISELLRILAQSLVSAPAPAYDGSAAEHAAMIMALAMADNPVPGRKAAWHVVGWLRFLAIARFARPAYGRPPEPSVTPLSGTLPASGGHDERGPFGDCRPGS